MQFLKPFRTTKTLVIVTSNWLARADFSGHRHPRLVSLKSEFCDPVTSLANGCVKALKLDQRPCSSVWILSPLIWSDSLRLPSDIVQIASPFELTQALALEAEAETGISSFNSRVVHQRIEPEQSGMIDYWVSQIDEDQLSQIHDCCNSMHAKLVSLSNPVSLVSVNKTVSADAIREQIKPWQGQLSNTSCPESIQKLAEEWATIWCSNFRCPSPLSIRPEKARVQVPKSLVGLTLAASAGAICYGLNYHLDQQIRLARTQIQQFEKAQTEANDVEATVRKFETKLVQLRKEQTEELKLHQAAEQKARAASLRQVRRNQLWSRLLDSLAKCSSDCWIQRIDQETGQTLIHGLAVSQIAAQKFAVELELDLLGSGWSISPAVTTPLSTDLFGFVVALSADESLPALPNPQQVVHGTYSDELDSGFTNLAARDLLP